MKSLRINSVGVEFPTNTTSVTVDIVESLGSITRVVETLTVDIPGIYQNMTNELLSAVTTEIINAGFDIPNPNTAE
jgi:hypothetical protein